VTAPPPRPVIELEEWRQVVRPDLELTDADRALAATLAQGQEGRLVVEELRAGLRVRATSWVGLVRFAGFDVRVAPKLAGEHVGLVQMLEFAAGLPGLRRLAASRTLEVMPDLDLFDLIALLLIEATDAVVRDGLLADYVEREETVAALRGRLLADRQLTRRFGRVDLLECRFDEWETDVPENQLLAAALGVCAARVRDDAVRLRARRLAALLAEVCDPAGADLRRIRETLVYTRLNEHYREAHALAWFVLEGLGVRDLLAAGDARSFAFLIDMNALFERFVWRVLDRLAAGRGWRVHYQRKDRSILWNEATDRSYAGVIPDLLVGRAGGSGGLLAIDAKYKQYDLRKLGNEDVYQTFLYAFAYAGDAALPEALVIYPASQPAAVEAALQVRDRRGRPLGRIRALGVHAPTLLTEARSGRPGPTTTLLADRIEGAFPVLDTPTVDLATGR
jgi:5-methylcytosine-specific restriction enzyme subunit McrC